MYKNNFVVAVKVGGKVLRESSGRVELPFGSEYSVLLKNLDSVRMQARISIDGEDATSWLVINPNSSIDVERFVKNLDRGNRFKFIERTEQIENHRGVKADDGLVRVEFKREKIYEAPKVVEHHTYTHHIYGYPCYRPYYPWITYTSQPSFTGAMQGSVTSTTGMRSGSGAHNVMAANMMHCSANPEISNEAGITVPGSESQQRFHLVSGFETESSQVITLHLVGYTGKVQVSRPRTVNLRLECNTCGKKNKSNSKFCSNCGASLETF